MATGNFAARPGGFSIKTALQTLVARQKYNVVRNVMPQVNVIAGDATLIIQPQVVVLTKGSAAAITLTAPTAGVDDGVRIQITCGSAFAHVVTATTLVQDGVTGGPKTTITMGAFLGASVELMAYNGFWHVLNLKVAVIT